MQTLQFKIGGMTCGGCVSSVTKVLKGLPGMQSAEVDLASTVATVSFDPALLDRAKIADAVDAAGYDALD